MDALARVEAELGSVPGRRRAEVMRRWAGALPTLADAGLGSPSEVPAWVWGLSQQHADGVLRGLLRLAQGGDGLALLAVLACLRPGLRALSARLRVPADEVVSEAAAVALEFPYEHRRTVAGQVLLDIRRRVGRQASREQLGGDTRCHLACLPAGGEVTGGAGMGRLTEVVRDAWRAGYVTGDAARLVVMTRVWGEPVAVAASRMGIGHRAALARRARAEVRLAQAVRGGASACCVGLDAL